MYDLPTSGMSCRFTHYSNNSCLLQELFWICRILSPLTRKRCKLNGIFHLTRTTKNASGHSKIKSTPNTMGQRRAPPPMTIRRRQRHQTPKRNSNQSLVSRNSPSSQCRHDHPGAVSLLPLLRRNSAVISFRLLASMLNLRCVD